MATKTRERLSRKKKHRAKRNKTRPREELQSVILDAATQLFAKRGFVEPTIRDIAKAAGVALPALYRIFADKRAIYAECCKLACRRYLGAVHAYTAPQGEPALQLYSSMMNAFTFNTTKNAAFRLLIRTALDGDLEIVKDEVALYDRSDVARTIDIAAREGSKNNQPILRLVMLTCFLSHFRDEVASMSTLDFDVNDNQTLVSALAILFPATDWLRVASTYHALSPKIRGQSDLSFAKRRNP